MCRTLVLLGLAFGCAPAHEHPRGHGSTSSALIEASLTARPTPVPDFAADGAPRDLFGNAIALDGDLAVIGVPGDSDGSVYVAERTVSGWELQAQLRPSRPVLGFGRSVAIDGDTIVVGAPFTGSTVGAVGAVFIFARVGGAWVSDGELPIGDPEPGMRFGSSVGVSGGTIAVGAPGDDHEGVTDQGTVTVYSRGLAGWEQDDRIAPDVADDNAAFGNSLALRGDTLLVGAEDEAGGAGAAYVYERVGGVFSQTERLTGGSSFGQSVAMDDDDIVIGSGARATVFRNDGTGWAVSATLSTSGFLVGFGDAVAVDGDTVLVGAPDTDGPPNSGAVHVFERSGGVFDETQVIRGEPESSYLGTTVAIGGEVALAGAPNVLLPGPEAIEGGVVVAYERTAGVFAPETRLVRAAAAGDDYFGHRVAMDGDVAVISAWEDSATDCRGCGAAYIYRKSGDLWTQEAKLRPDGLTNYSRFGNTVDIDGDTALIGETRSGRVFVYRETGGAWTLEATLTAGVSFGTAVSISGDVAAVIAPNEFNGYVYVFERSGVTWTQVARLSPRDPVSGRFGYLSDVTIDDEVIVAGTANFNGRGRAFVFGRVGSTFRRIEPSFAPELLPNADFGAKVALDGERLVVGAPGAGRVYVYERTGASFAPLAQVDSPDLAVTSFGNAVSVDGPSVLVGDDSGNAYLYVERGGVWELDDTETVSDGAGVNFGQSVAVSGGSTLIGAPRTDGLPPYGNELEGAAYFGTVSDIGALGSLCIDNAECGSGFCVDGVCCESACVGTCDACGEAGMLGECVTINGAPRGDRAGCMMCVDGVCDDGMPGGLGDVCLDDGECESGHCVDGFCCERACTGTCKACDVAGSEGMCEPISGAPRGDREGCDTCLLGGCADDTGLLGDGEACLEDAECARGHCVDGVCCQWGCAGTCKACGEPGDEGFCVPISGAPRGVRTGCLTCDEGACIDDTGAGTLGAECALDSECASGSCTDGVCCERACRGTCKACAEPGFEGMCVPVSGAPRGERDACSFCDEGVCSEVGTLGSSCGDDSLCESGFCVDGVCCERACRGTCKACGEPGSEGMCVAVSGAPRGDRDECSTCDAGVCVGADPLGTACGADGDCESGYCTDGVCCERLCGGTCKACAEPGFEGMCVPVSGAPRGDRTGCAACDVGVCAD